MHFSPRLFHHKTDRTPWVALVAKILCRAVSVVQRRSWFCPTVHWCVQTRTERNAARLFGRSNPDSTDTVLRRQHERFHHARIQKQRTVVVVPSDSTPSRFGVTRGHSDSSLSGAARHFHFHSCPLPSANKSANRILFPHFSRSWIVRAGSGQSFPFRPLSGPASGGIRRSFTRKRSTSSFVYTAPALSRRFPRPERMGQRTNYRRVRPVQTNVLFVLAGVVSFVGGFAVTLTAVRTTRVTFSRSRTTLQATAIPSLHECTFDSRARGIRRR